MSDSDNDVRLLATETFATLVKLVPLEAGIPDPPGMSEKLLAERNEERKFIAQMLDGSKVDAFEIPVAIRADLRKSISISYMVSFAMVRFPFKHWSNL